jgi:hypothetical protein
LITARRAAVRRERLARDDIHPVSSDPGDRRGDISGLAVQIMLSDRVGAVGLAAGLTMMIISRKRSRLRIVKLENLGWPPGVRNRWPQATGVIPLPAGGYSGWHGQPGE